MTMRLPATVYLVDDSAPIRERLRELLAQLDSVLVVGEAGTVTDAIAGIRTTHPHYVLLDYRLPDGTGLDVLRATASSEPDTVFVVLTNHYSDQLRAACTGAGAHHFLDKSGPFDRLNAIVVEAQ